MALSDNQQALIMFISLSLIGVGAVSIPVGAPWYIGFGLVILGIIGGALKEAFGAKPAPKP